MADTPRARRQNEISQLIVALEIAWRKCPEQRLGQLIVNALPPHYAYSTFYIPDDELTRVLRDYGEKHGNT